MRVVKFIEDLAEELNIKVRWEKGLIKESWSSYKEIVLGEYEDKELELISFFHELGHSEIAHDFILKWDYNTLLIELECWNIGIEKARKMNILFSDNAIKWGLNQALTYVGHDEREVSTWNERVSSKLWKNI